MNGQRHLVELQELTRRYDDHLALDKVSLRIRQGEFFSILGPSGCGKSTLLRLIAGLDWPDAGSLLIDGRDMRGVPPYRRPCNMVFQNYAIFPHLNVRDNVGYGLRKFGLSATEKRCWLALKFQIAFCSRVVLAECVTRYSKFVGTLATASAASW